VLWKVGTIAPGRSVHGVVTLKARRLGRDEMLIAAGSLAGDPPCQSASGSVRCQAFAIAALRAVRAPAHHPSSHTTPPVGPATSPAGSIRSQSAPALADTGPAHAGSLTAFGGSAIGVGALLLLLGSIRPRPDRRH
jgi:hypothetical protein